MTTAVIHRVRCDAVDPHGARCRTEIQAPPEQDTTARFRRWLTAQGWHHDRAGTDTCPTCQARGRYPARRPGTTADHRLIAGLCHRYPHQWQHVTVYPARTTADSTAYQIRAGRIPAYQPASRFQAKVRRHPDGWAVTVRYTPTEETP